MFCHTREMIVRIILTGSIGIISHLGDRGLKYGKTSATRALVDNLTHATVGGLTWALIIVLSKNSLVHNLHGVFLCFSLSSFVDIDHFMSARSWKLNDAIQLERRPFLHCSTIPVLAWIFLGLSSSVLNCPKMFYYAWIILASFLSHHLRDANRRGFWFCPIGSTPPVPYHMYIILSMVFPYILYWLMNLQIVTLKSSSNDTKIIDIV